MSKPILKGADLDLAVAKALGIKARISYEFGEPVCLRDLPLDPIIGEGDFVAFEPSSKWVYGGKLIEEYKIDLEYDHDDPEDKRWFAIIHDFTQHDIKSTNLYKVIGTGYGATPLEAAMRAFVASREE